MKSKLAFSLIIFLTVNFSASAQKNKIRFRSINTSGLVGGESKAGTAFQSVNGIQFSNWFSGIGVGVDDYSYKTLPLFMDGRWFFGDNKNGFIYGDIGYNFPMKNKPGKEVYYYDTYEFTGSVYTDFGIGLKAKFIKKYSMLLSLGYSYKELQAKIGMNACGTGPCSVDYSKYDYNFNRMILKAGLVF